MPVVWMMLNVAMASPIAADLPVEVHRIRLSNGVTIQYAEQGPRWGRPMVMLHGFTDSWRSFELLLDTLPSDVRAIAVDLRGHGGSDRPATGYGIPDLAGDVVDLLQRLNLRGVTLIGHSMGSFVAREVARRAADRVDGLVLIGSATMLRNPLTESLVREIGAMGDRIPAAFIRDFQYGTVARPVDEAFMARMIAASATVPAPVWQALGEGMMRYDDRRRLDALDLPIFVIWGDRDGIFPLEEQERLFSHVRDGQLSIYAGTGHAPHWEEPGRVASEITRFMLRYAPPRPGAEER